jgi:hypothetical protein
MLGCTDLKTAEFRIKEGYPVQKVKVPKNILYYLNFGGKKYKIQVSDPGSVANFFTDKAFHALDWNKATLWDNKYKRQEYSFLEKYIEIGIFT